MSTAPKSRQISELQDAEATIVAPPVAFSKNVAGWIEYAAHSENILYVPVILVLVVAALNGFHRSGYLAAGDNWPAAFIPGNHEFEHSLQLWVYSITGVMGSPHFAPDSFILGLWGRFWLSLGVSGPDTQFLFMAAMVLWEGIGMTRFMRALFPERRFAAIVAGIGLPLSLFNIFTFTWPTQLFAVGYFPWFASLLINALRRPEPVWQSAIKIGLATLGIMLLAAPPPMAVVFVVWSLTWLIVGWRAWGTFRRTLPAIALGLGIGLILNSWWVFAGYITLYGSGGSAQQTFADPLTWSWVSAHASILNLLSMQGFWSWPRPEYFPWASQYSQGLLQFSLFIPLLLAEVGLVLSPLRRRTLLLLWLILVSLFVAKGTHAPLESVNVFLYRHLPLYWLMREPQIEIGNILYVALYALAGLGAAEIAYKLGTLLRARQALRAIRIIGSRTGEGVLIALVASSGYALVSGAFIPSTVLQGEAKPIINVPQYWADAAQFINAHRSDSGVLILPNDDYYQMPYSWGLYSFDGLPQTIIDKPIFYLSSNIGGYLNGSSPLLAQQDRLLALIRDNIPKTPIAPILQALDIEWIVERKDVRWIWPNRSIVSAPQVLRYLHQQPGIRLVRTFGQLAVYRVMASVSRIQTYASAGQWYGNSYPNLAATAARMGATIPWVTDVVAPARLPIAARAWLEYNNHSSIGVRSRSVARNAAFQPEKSKQRTGGQLRIVGQVPHAQSANWSGNGPTYRVTIPPGARLLVLRTAYSPDWAIAEHGHSLHWQHVVVDGFLNGWIIPMNAPTAITITYSPAHIFVLLGYGDLAALCALSVALLVGSLLRYRKHTQRHLAATKGRNM